MYPFKCLAIARTIDKLAMKFVYFMVETYLGFFHKFLVSNNLIFVRLNALAMLML